MAAMPGGSRRPQVDLRTRYVERAMRGNRRPLRAARARHRVPRGTRADTTKACALRSRAVLVLVLASGCYHGTPVRAVSIGGAAGTTERLRRAVALDPADRAARLALADDAAAHGRPSEALREYQHVVQAGTLLVAPLNGAQRTRFAGLLHHRGTLRAHVGDAGALADLHAAQRAGALVTAAELHRARLVDALWMTRHADVVLQARGLTALVALSREASTSFTLRCSNALSVALPVRSADAAVSDARFQAITTIHHHADWHVAAWLWAHGAQLVAGRMAVALAETMPTSCQPALSATERDVVLGAAQWWRAPGTAPLAISGAPLAVDSEPSVARDAATAQVSTPDLSPQLTPRLARVLGELTTFDVAELARIARVQPTALAQRAQTLVDQQLDAEAASRTVGMILLAWVPQVGAPAMHAARQLLERYAEPSADPQTTFVLALRFAIDNDGAAAMLWATRAAAALGDPADVLVAVALAAVDREPVAALSLLRAAHGQPTSPSTQAAAAWARRVAHVRLHREAPVVAARDATPAMQPADHDWLVASWTAALAIAQPPAPVRAAMPSLPAAWPAWFAHPDVRPATALAASWERNLGAQLPRYAPALQWYALAALARAILQDVPSQ